MSPRRKKTARIPSLNKAPGQDPLSQPTTKLPALNPLTDSVTPRKKMRFQCPFCSSSLRIPAVRKRTRIRCPRCTGDFHVYPDGRVDAPSERAPQAPASALAPEISNRETISLSAIPVVDLPAESSEASAASSSTPNWVKTRHEMRAQRDTAPPPLLSQPRKPRNSSLLESGDFDPTATGIKFESVNKVATDNLRELRAIAGINPIAAPSRRDSRSVSSPRTSSPTRSADDNDYILLPQSDDSIEALGQRIEVTRSGRGRKRHAKKKRRKSEIAAENRVPVAVPLNPQRRAQGDSDSAELELLPLIPEFEPQRLDATKASKGKRKKTARLNPQQGAAPKTTSREASNRRRRTGKTSLERRDPLDGSPGKITKLQTDNNSQDSSRSRPTPTRDPSGDSARFDSMSSDGEGLSRRSSSTSLTLLLVLAVAPSIATALVLFSTTRGRGFASTGALGDTLNDYGKAVERGANRLWRLTSGAK